jgi:hypothetical protein
MLQSILPTQLCSKYQGGSFTDCVHTMQVRMLLLTRYVYAEDSGLTLGIH